jgi:hypothetical protein
LGVFPEKTFFIKKLLDVFRRVAEEIMPGGVAESFKGFSIGLSRVQDMGTGACWKRRKSSCRFCREASGSCGTWGMGVFF